MDYENGLFSHIPDKIEREFNDFHAANPHIYERLVAMANKLKSKGHKRYGIAVLYGVLRYKHDIKTVAADDWKLNNNHKALYSRMIMDKNPHLKGFFEIRKRNSE
jgi:hypothetical protein